MTRLIAIDVETSGLHPSIGGEIILFSALELNDRTHNGLLFNKLYRPKRPLTPEAEEFTGIKNATLERSPRFSEVADDLLSFLANAEIVSLDWQFDSIFLNQALVDSGRPPLQPMRVIDLGEIVPIEFRNQGYDGIFMYACINRDPLNTPSEEVARLYWSLI